jgi:PAN domain
MWRFILIGIAIALFLWYMTSKRDAFTVVAEAFRFIKITSTTEVRLSQFQIITNDIDMKIIKPIKSEDNVWQIDLGADVVVDKIVYTGEPTTGMKMVLMKSNGTQVGEPLLFTNDKVQAFHLKTGEVEAIQESDDLTVKGNQTVVGTTSLGKLTAGVTELGDTNVKGNSTVSGSQTVSGDLFSHGVKVSGPNWTGYPDNSTTQSEISNDTTQFKQLMIVGNKSGGGERRVGIWDTLNVNGTLNVTGDTRASGSFLSKYTHTPYTDAGGNDITHLNNSTYSQCKGTCDNDPACKGFNFPSSAFPNGTGQCWIKNDVVNKTNTPHWHLFSKNF